MNVVTIDENQKNSLVQIKPITFEGSESQYERQKLANELNNPANNVKKEKKMCVTFEDKIKSDTESKVNQLLGSVTIQNSPGTRTSARVIQKMKQDQSRPITPPLMEIKKDDKSIPKTPSQVRPLKSTWTNLERDYFFDALNEFSKDFEAIANYINCKLKRKSSTESCKTKDQIRQHYYQTYHKICRYIKFSDEIKKPIQEMYALINYGEMRRKLQFVTDKHFMKLKNLVYQGHVMVRSKGKNVRIKTPSCKALRKVNQLDDTLEDIRLPAKIDVIITPANMEAFGRVQTIAQNPRARITVPLHKKLFSFIKAFQYKWRTTEIKLAEEKKKYVSNIIDFSICFLPKPGVTIHRPLLSITEYLSSENLSLNSFEERIGVKIRSEEVTYQDRISNKRQRTDSNSEKRSPDYKKIKNEKNEPTTTTNNDNVSYKGEIFNPESENVALKSESSGDELCDELNELLANTDTPLNNVSTTIETVKIDSSSSSSHLRSKRYNPKNSRTAISYKPLLNEDIVKQIRKGWTISSAGDLTIGDLYVVLGQDSKLELDYYWTCEPYISSSNINSGSNESNAVIQKETVGVFMQKHNGMPYNPNECEDSNLLQSLSTTSINNKLKHLILIANLSERIRKRQCSCGHFCDRSSIKAKIERDFVAKTYVTNKTYIPNTDIRTNEIFRQPELPTRRPTANINHIKHIIPQTRFKTPRQVNMQPLTISSNKNLNKNESDIIPNEEYYQNSTPDLIEEKSVTQAAITITTTSNDISSSNKSVPAICNIEITVNNPPVIPLKNNFLNSSQSTNLSKNNCIASTQNTIKTETSSKENTDTKMPSVPCVVYDDSTANMFNGSISPTNLLRETSSNSRWLEENLNDFSLTSLLGHLEDINSPRDILDPSSNISIISESSVDYRHKFQEIAALMQSQEKE